MDNRIYKQPPLSEMYIGVHFHADPPIGVLDFQQFLIKVKENFKKEQYIFPIIERIGDLSKIPTEPEKIWFYSNDETKLLQFLRDRMVYNWRAGTNQPVIYPKYDNIKSEFLNYWNILSEYIRNYKNRKLNIKMCELYYSNILPIGEKHFLKSDLNLHEVFNFISPYPESYKKVIPHINLEIPIDQDTLFLRLEKIKDNKENREAFLLVFSMRGNKKLDDIDINWYDKANQNINKLFTEITTDAIRNFWKGEI